jgi:hypothetical protein
VLSVRRRQLVAIPFSQFRLVPSQSIGRRLGRRGRRFTGIATTAFGLFGVMLPGASPDSLASMETFRFVPSP